MANVQITFTPREFVFPFQIPTGLVQPHTAIPRARFTFIVTAGVVTAKIATNTTSISINAALPANYAYMIEYANAHIQVVSSTSDADNFDDLGAFTFVNAWPAGNFSRANMVAPGILGVGANAGSAKIWEADNAYGGPLFNLDGNQVTATIELNDNDAGATAVGSLGSIITVLQYDLQQVFNFPMNFPIPVTARGT